MGLCTTTISNVDGTDEGAFPETPIGAGAAADAPRPPANYPAPIVDLAAGRDRALAAFKALPKR